MTMPALSIARANSIILTNRMMNMYRKKLLLQHLQTKKLKQKSCYRMSKKFK